MRTIIALGIAGVLAGPVAAQTVPMTRDTGVPVGDNQDSKVAGPEGPVLLEDMNLIEKLARFDRERIPERVVHARGTGAQGVFVASTDFSKYTKASVFATPGKETPVFVRFSTVMNFRGSPEAARDPRGFAVKFYTDQGNWDVVGINEPIFFIRDAIKFPDFVHANKPSPVTNSKGEAVFAKFHWKSQQGLKGMTLEEQRAADTNYATKDLYDNIRQGNFPKWDLEVQLLTAQQVAQLSYDGFDDTKVWSDVPYVKVGTMTLNKVPDNFFAETEQSAFCPCELVPGIEPSPDRMLQGRLFSYADTQRYRVGSNYMELPVNRPLVKVANNNIDGAMQDGAPQGDVNYEPTTVAGHPVQEPKFRYSQYSVSGMTQEKAIDKQDNFRQAGEFYRSLSKHEQDDLIKNLASDLGQVKSDKIKDTMLSHFYKADKDYGTRLAAAVGVDIRSAERMHSRN